MQQLELQLRPIASKGPSQLAMALLLPVAAGTRAATAPQHLVFLTGEHLLDLQVDYDDCLTIVGQIVNRRYRAVTDAKVQAVSEHGVLESSVTGSGGEFLVACRPRGTVRLSIPVSADSTIELPLPSRKEIRCHEKIH